MAIIAGLHAALLVSALMVTVKPQVLEALSTMDLRLLEERPDPPEEKAKPLPPVPERRVTAPAPPPPGPIMTSTAPAEESTDAFTVPAPPADPGPPSPPGPVGVATEESGGSGPPGPEPVVAARFDADYLHNPAPSYPYSSRRNLEQGRVVLMVLVSADGNAKSVRVHKGSGFSALDDAALDAVRLWRFVPARRGSEAVEDWVLVPLNFQLKH